MTTAAGSPSLEEMLADAPPVRREPQARERIRALNLAAGRRIAVLDDDPTGRRPCTTCPCSKPPSMPYLTYLSLVEGVGLDYPVLLGRTFTSPFKHEIRYGGLGVDLELFNRHVSRLERLGY